MSRLLVTLSLISACAAPGGRVNEPEPELAPPPGMGLELDVSPIRPGRPASWTVSGLHASERVYLGRGPGLSTSGPCLPAAGGLCLDIAAPTALLGTAIADANGEATLDLNLPPTLPVGLNLGFQAVAIRGLGGVDSVKSGAVPRRTEIGSGVDLADLGAGDLVITEVMRDPTAVPDAMGEWLEVRNPGALDIELYGLEVADGAGGRMRVREPFVLVAGGAVVLGASADPGANGGVPVDLAWGSGLSLGDTDGSLTLSFDGATFDALVWTAADHPSAPGLSLSLDPARGAAGEDDDPAAWCLGDPPTPGVENDPCPVPYCGDGTVDPGEQCDDGGTSAGDGCDASCALEGCLLPEIRVGDWRVGPSSSIVHIEGTRDGGVSFIGDTWVSGRRRLSSTVIDGPTMTPGPTISWDAGSNLAPVRRLEREDGNSMIVGRYAHGGGGAQIDWNVYLMLVDPAGSVLWANHYSYYSYWSDEVYDAVALPDGSTITVGETNYDPVYHVDQRGEIMKIDTNGDTEWSMVSTSNKYLRRIYPLKDGTFMVTSSLGAMLRIRDNGTMVWSRDIYMLVGRLEEMVELANGDLVFGGTLRSLPGLLVMSADGVLKWQKALALPVGATVDNATVTALPETCDGSPTTGAICSEPGAWCATAGELCDCDSGGTWTCTPGEQTIALAWKGNGVSAPAAKEVLVSTFDVDGMPGETTSFPGFDLLDRVDVDPQGTLMISGYELGSHHVVRTDASLTGACGGTTLPPLTPTTPTWALRDTRQSTGVSSTVYTWPAFPAASASTGPTLTGTCDELICP